VVLLAAAKKKARQLQYEVRWVAVSHYYHSYLHQKMSKKEAQKQRLTLNREQYMKVSIRDFSFQRISSQFHCFVLTCHASIF
jgi:hypothetical protein